MNQLKQKIIVGLFASIVSGSLSFGFSQVTVASKVAVVSQKLDDIAHEQTVEKNRTDARLFEAVGLMREILKADQELIVLIKLQNQK